jgi:hypothetical protein
MLVNHELVGASEVYLRREVPAQFAAKRTLDRDGLERELLDAGWNIAAAAFALHHEGLAA